VTGQLAPAVLEQVRKPWWRAAAGTDSQIPRAGIDKILAASEIAAQRRSQTGDGEKRDRRLRQVAALVQLVSADAPTSGQQVGRPDLAAVPRVGERLGILDSGEDVAGRMEQRLDALGRNQRGCSGYQRFALRP